MAYFQMRVARAAFVLSSMVCAVSTSAMPSYTTLRAISAATLLALLIGCGGGSTPGDPQVLLQNHPVASNAGPLGALALPTAKRAASVRVLDASSFLNWAELTYPSLFEAPQSNKTIDVWTYRYYPKTDIYLGTNTSGDVLGLVGKGGGQYDAYPLGKLVDFSCSVFPADCAKPNAAPVANAGADQSVVFNAAVTLDGSTSADANSDPLTYSWTLTSKPAGSSASLVNPTSAKPTFTADSAGSYVATLTVNDGNISSAADSVSVTVGGASATSVADSAALLSSQVWVGSYKNGTVVVVQRFGSAGELLSAQFGASENGGMSGLEYGTALATSVDGRGFKLTPNFEIDTNGTFGLSHLSACERVSVANGQLTYLQASASCVTDTTTTLTKADNDPNGIVGVWLMGHPTAIRALTFVFWANGKYALLDRASDTAPGSCGRPGVEYGTYSYNATSKEFKVLSVSVDTNGCFGANDTGGNGMASFSITLSSDGMTATLVASDSTDQIFRVSR